MSAPEREHGLRLAGELAVSWRRGCGGQEGGERVVTDLRGGRGVAQQLFRRGRAEPVPVRLHLMSFSVAAFICVTRVLACRGAAVPVSSR